jgi:hypothetical protein
VSVRQLKVALFLGAGASVPYGKPTTQKLKEQLQPKYEEKPNSTRTPEEHYLSSIMDFPYFEDIEHVLQGIKELDDFLTRSKYGGRYLLENIPQYVARDDRRPWPLKNLAEKLGAMRRRVEDDVFTNYSWDHTADGSLATIVGQLFNLIKNYSEDIHVFTTNYDRAVEEYCSNGNRKCRCIDGFKLEQFSNRRLWEGKFEYIREPDMTNVYLCKLHGSLSWKKHKLYGIEATTEERRSLDPNYVENLLVYPTVSPKDGQEIEPYRTIREEFRKYMETADVCIVIGFSFRDEHINSVFREFFERGKHLMVISPSAEANIFQNFFQKAVPEEDGNIGLTPDAEIRAVFREQKKICIIGHPITQQNIGAITSTAELAIHVATTGDLDEVLTNEEIKEKLDGLDGAIDTEMDDSAEAPAEDRPNYVAKINALRAEYDRLKGILQKRGISYP